MPHNELTASQRRAQDLEAGGLRVTDRRTPEEARRALEQRRPRGVVRVAAAVGRLAIVEVYALEARAVRGERAASGLGSKSGAGGAQTVGGLPLRERPGRG